MRDVNKTELVERFILIDWANKKTLRTNCRLTEDEAQRMNQGFGLNNISLRYVKVTSRFGKDLTKHMDCDSIKEYKIRNNK
jgi:hypothetical protein